jgi:hypothetical protein
LVGRNQAETVSNGCFREIKRCFVQARPLLYRTNEALLQGATSAKEGALMQVSGATNARNPARRTLHPSRMTVLVIDPDEAVGSELANSLKRDGHLVLTRTSPLACMSDMRAFDPQVIVIDPQSSSYARVVAMIRLYFAHVYVIAYSNEPASRLRGQGLADLVLQRNRSPSIFASQFRCWARYV